jgi:hypothetical protein
MRISGSLRAELAERHDELRKALGAIRANRVDEAPVGSYERLLHLLGKAPDKNNRTLRPRDRTRSWLRRRDRIGSNAG